MRQGPAFLALTSTLSLLPSLFGGCRPGFCVCGHCRVEHPADVHILQLKFSQVTGSQQVRRCVLAPLCIVSEVQRFCRLVLGPAALELPRTGNTLEMRTVVSWWSKQRLGKNFQTQSILEKRGFIDNEGLR